MWERPCGSLGQKHLDQKCADQYEVIKFVPGECHKTFVHDEIYEGKQARIPSVKNPDIQSPSTNATS